MNWNILLVEDDPVLGPLTKESLRVMDNTVDLAAGIREALEYVRGGQRYDVILLDLQLGSERGERLVEKLAESHLPIPPVILFSAQPVAELQRSMRVTRAATALQKPCTVQQIEAAIADAVEH